jgi:hypothetical protein
VTTGEERWEPDEGLVYAVQHRPVPISDLSGPDRAWVVAFLTTQGWTVASIAERLRCSLRLIQQIKAEPMTQVAAHCQRLRAQVDAVAALAHLDGVAAATDLAAAQARIAALERQRDVILHRLLERDHSHEVPHLPRPPRPAARRRGEAPPLRVGERG